jgi:type I restriction enzyme S subunit
MTWVTTRLKFLSREPITTGLGEAGQYSDPTWPRYIRTTDIAGPRALRDDTFASLPPSVAAGARVAAGDILMTSAGATVGKHVLLGDVGEACHAGFLSRFRAGPLVLPEFVSYWMESTAYWTQIDAGKIRSTIDNFSAGRYRNLRIAVPGVEEQGLIVEFLDAEIARIDELINEQLHQQALSSERLAGRREELLVSARTHRVPLQTLTDPARPIVYGIVQAGPEVSDGVPYIKTGDVKALDVSSLSRTSPEIDAAYFRARVVPGDFVMAMRASIGALAEVPESLPAANLTQGTARIAARRDVDRRWLFQVLQTAAVQQEARVRAVGTTFLTLNIGDLRRLPVPFVPPELQRKLGADLDREERVAALLAHEIEGQVALLREHRRALITAAVTGGLDAVRRVS